MSTEGLDPFEQARMHAMLEGYEAVWDHEDVEVLAVELPFVRPLVDDLGLESATWKLAGTLDLVLRWSDGRTKIVDHKSAADSAFYARRAVINGQVGAYFEAADSLGWECSEFIFDVLVKPALDPLEATPLNRRKYTKPTKTEPSRPYAGQREADETPAEFYARCVEAIAANPAKYYPRYEVLRHDQEQRGYQRSVWQTTELIDVCTRRELWDQNSDACAHHGRTCEFWQSCAEMASIDDDTLYEQDEYASQYDGHTLTNSKRSAFNACRRLYYNRHVLQRTSRKPSPSLVFGTEIHNRLETYWRSRMTAAQR